MSYEAEQQPNEHIPPEAEQTGVKDDIAALYPGGQVFVDGEWRSPARPPLTRAQLFMAGHWARAIGKNPNSMKVIRKVVDRHHPTYAIRAAIDTVLGGSLNRFDELLAATDSMEWPQSLLDGAPAWSPPAPQSQELRRPAQPVAHCTETLPSLILPSTWSEVCMWYQEKYPLEYRVAETAPPELAPSQDALLGDWGMYWVPELSQTQGRNISDQVLNLEGIPHIQDYVALEESLESQAYLCIMNDRDIRNGSEADPEALTSLTKTETVLLNLLLLHELRTGRPVGVERLRIHSGYTEAKTRRNLGTLIEKINGPNRHRTIVKARRDHYCISESATIVDYRDPLPKERVMKYPSAVSLD